MVLDDLPDELRTIGFSLYLNLGESELEIAKALAEADEPLTRGELVERTDYSESTVYRGVDALEDELDGEPLLSVSPEGRVSLAEEVTKPLRRLNEIEQAGER